ncbi:MAG: MBL fold metallo-hydrolase [Rhodobacteraceae bacterium]|nr:MBL fold metallo-hydrolase [Paracoccaceae bacterium]
MKFNRRHFLSTAAAAVTTGAVSTLNAPKLWAASEMTLGSATLQTLSDGYLTLPPEFIFGPMPKDQLQSVLATYEIGDSLTPDCNVTLLRDGNTVALFDVGAGTAFQDSAGQLLGALEAAGLTPEDVTHVIFTHAHPDHLWGVLDDFDDPLFLNAQHMMGQVEWEYWFDPDTVNTIQSERASMAVGARRRMEVLEDQITLFQDGDEVLPGVAALASHGHTPGHMAFEVRQGSDAAMIVGDAIGNHHVGFAKPDWRSGSDQDQEMGVQSRKMLLDRLASEQMALIGFHLPDGGIGRAERDGTGYRFVSE